MSGASQPAGAGNHEAKHKSFKAQLHRTSDAIETWQIESNQQLALPLSFNLLQENPLCRQILAPSRLVSNLALHNVVDAAVIFLA